MGIDAALDVVVVTRLKVDRSKFGGGTDSDAMRCDSIRGGGRYVAVRCVRLGLELGIRYGTAHGRLGRNWERMAEGRIGIRNGKL